MYKGILNLFLKFLKVALFKSLYGQYFNKSEEVKTHFVIHYHVHAHYGFVCPENMYSLD